MATEKEYVLGTHDDYMAGAEPLDGPTVGWARELAQELGIDLVAGSIVAFSAYGIAVRTLPTATVATYAYVNPVIAVLLGALILGEHLTPAMLAGGALIVGAVVLVVRRRPRE